MTDTYICGVDVGTSKCVASIARVQKGKLQSFFIEEAPAQGIKGGVIFELASFSNTLDHLLGKLSKKSQCKIKNIYLGIFGPYMDFTKTKAVIALAERGNKVITLSDLRKVNEQARSLGLSWDKEIIHEIPQKYRIDNNDDIAMPLGLYGHSLAVELHLITSPVSYIENFLRAVNQAGFNIEEIVFSSLAINYAISDESEDYLLIDFGEDFTRMMNFKKRILTDAEILDFGGSDLTKSISSALDIPFELAGEIKEKYAVIGSSQIPLNQEVMIKKPSGYFPLKRKHICDAVEKELIHFFNLLKEKIEEKAMDKKEPLEILVSGGTVSLEGFIEIAESVIGRRLKIAKLKDSFLGSLAKEVNYAASIGLLYYGLAIQQKNKKQALSPTGLSKRILSKIKELYWDYF